MTFQEQYAEMHKQQRIQKAKQKVEAEKINKDQKNLTSDECLEKLGEIIGWHETETKPFLDESRRALKVVEKSKELKDLEKKDEKKFWDELRKLADDPVYGEMVRSKIRVREEMAEFRQRIQDISNAGQACLNGI